MLRRVSLLCLVVLSGATAVVAADSKDPLVRARTLYNQGHYDDAIVAADEARKTPDRAPQADLIAARAFLERFRTSQAGADLISARERLRRLEPVRFSASERLEYLVGLGQTLYFDNASGASAVLFASVLDGPPYEMSAAARERILDWWATALDRDAQRRPDIERQGIYQRIRERMAEESALDAGNPAALYWAASAARAQGDLQAAWDAAQAAWVRASLAGSREATLRQDLEELVTKAILPERARIMAQPAEMLATEWDAFKNKWRP